jgi:hypothetical protein
VHARISRAVPGSYLLAVSLSGLAVRVQPQERRQHMGIVMTAASPGVLAAAIEPAANSTKRLYLTWLLPHCLACLPYMTVIAQALNVIRLSCCKPRLRCLYCCMSWVRHSEAS